MAQMDRLAESQDTRRADWDAIDIEYHHTMGRITHNKIAENMYEYIIELFAPTINAMRGYRPHRNLHKAIMARDLERAHEMLQKHTDTWKEIYFEQQPDREPPPHSPGSPSTG
jgi:DNA-binding GntR family transcriptional regulator